MVCYTKSSPGQASGELASDHSRPVLDGHSVAPVEVERVPSRPLAAGRRSTRGCDANSVVGAQRTFRDCDYPGGPISRTPIARDSLHDGPPGVARSGRASPALADGGSQSSHDHCDEAAGGAAPQKRSVRKDPGRRTPTGLKLTRPCPATGQRAVSESTRMKLPTRTGTSTASTRQWPDHPTRLLSRRLTPSLPTPPGPGSTARSPTSRSGFHGDSQRG
jgi:hypothetical protein